MATILIIDDEENMRTLVRCALSNHYTLLEARDGLEGFHKFVSHNPDLIITDLSMPIMTGIELVKKVRASGVKVQIIAISASFHNKEEKIAMLDAGADICLSKPLAISFLERVVAHTLNHTYCTRHYLHK
jgi:DNA-binding response OmpR family regulator